MRISIDAMGGDNAPESIVTGVLQAIAVDPSLTVILVGDEAQITSYLPQGMPANIEVVHTTEVISADDEPVRAVRRKKASSLVTAMQMAREGRVDAMISAGNTGALMTAGLLYTGRIEGIERPALAAIVPNMKGQVTLALDIGANMDAKAQHLVQYAIMGSLYADKVLGYPNPRVGLLNVGTEAAKGNELSKETYPLLTQLPINFIGNVEARDVMDGVCDVIICDGFAGNVMLKAMEGTASSIFSQLKRDFMASFINKLGAALLKPSLTRFKKRMDYSEYGGAPLLGLRHPVIKAHGSSNATAIKNAVLAASRFVTRDVNGLIQEELK